MDDKEITTKADEEEVDADTTAEDTEEEADADADSPDTEDESKANKDSDSEIDLDAEIAKEQKGKPDPSKAKDAFIKRKEKRAQKDETGVDDTADDDEGDDSAPLTRKDLKSVESKIRAEMQEERALEIATSMAGSPKEAQLIVMKWKNRSFPPHLSLSEQMQEAYAITHAKKLIGERNEALRGLKGKSGVNTNGAGTHRDAQKGSEPKIAPAEKTAILAAGFVYNTTARRYEKKLGNGKLLIRDKDGKARVVPLAK